MTFSDDFTIGSAEELMDAIERLGFVPFFENEIPGFSIEEHIGRGCWYDDGDNGFWPAWEWKGPVIKKTKCAYGKFLRNKAMYISPEFFPDFANYRRDGYDFDTLVDEGAAPHREKKLMAPFLTGGLPNDAALYSFVLKAEAGFGPGGEKNYEGVLTDLQMRTYLIIGDFRQRLNRRGQPYGWHLAVIQTPEAKLGYDAIAAAYSEAPRVSREKIFARVRRFFPNASGPQLDRWLGIRGAGAAEKKRSD